MEFEQSYKMSDWLRQHFSITHVKVVKDEPWRQSYTGLTPEEASAVCTITEVFKLQVSLFKKNSWIITE